MLRPLLSYGALASLSLLLLILSAGCSPTRAAAEQPAPATAAHDVLVLVDVTQSMAEDHGGSSAWTAVSAALATLIDSLAGGTHVAVVPFDAGPRLALAYPQAADAAVRPVAVDANVVKAMQAHIASLPIDGEGTHIYESVEFALDQLASWRGETPGLTRLQTLLLFTDGEDTGPHAPAGVGGWAGLVEQAQLSTTTLSVVYHDVRRLLNQTDHDTLVAAGVQVASVEALPQVALETRSVDLGTVHEGTVTTAELQLTTAFRSVFGRNVELAIRGPEHVRLGSSASTLSPTIGLELSFTDGLAAGEHEVEVTLRSMDGDFLIAPPDRATVHFEVAPRPPATAGAQAATSLAPGQPAGIHAIPPAAAYGAVAAALIALGVVLTRRIARPRKASDTRYYRLLIRQGTEPTSLIDPEARLLALTAEDLRQDPGVATGHHPASNPDWTLLHRHLALTLRKGELHVRALSSPLFIGGQPVPPEGRRLRPGEIVHLGELYVRYDRFEVTS